MRVLAESPRVIQPPRAAAFPGGRARGSQLDFELLQALGRKPDGDDPAVLRETASKLLADLFFKPLLAEMRKMPFGQKFAHGGQAEAIFGEQLDVRVADAVAAADPGGLTSLLTARLQPTWEPVPTSEHDVRAAYGALDRTGATTRSAQGFSEEVQA